MTFITVRQFRNAIRLHLAPGTPFTIGNPFKPRALIIPMPTGHRWTWTRDKKLLARWRRTARAALQEANTWTHGTRPQIV